MKSTEEYAKKLYLTDEYITLCPSIAKGEGSAWVVAKILPYIDRFVYAIGKDEIDILDVGGGAGLILSEISAYIERVFGVAVNKFAVELSPGMLDIQKKANPDLKKALNEDICKTSLDDKEVDLTLMIDVLEHVPNPVAALEELRRVSKYVILKVPLEDDLSKKVWHILDREKPRQHQKETLGHIIFYNLKELKTQIERYASQVLELSYANVFEYYRSSPDSQNWKRKELMRIRNYVAYKMFRVSPRLCSFVFPDHVVVLVKCY